jgi:hypothetical protein
MRVDPDLTIDGFLATLHYGNEADSGHLREGLAIAEAAQAERAGPAADSGAVTTRPKHAEIVEAYTPPDNCR